MVPNAVEMLPKISTASVGRTSVTDDIRQTDGRAIAYSEREREFTFTKNPRESPFFSRMRRAAMAESILIKFGTSTPWGRDIFEAASKLVQGLGRVGARNYAYPIDFTGTNV